MTDSHEPSSNYIKQLDLYTEYAEDLNADSKFVIDGTVPITKKMVDDYAVMQADEMWGISEYDQGVLINQCNQDTVVVDEYDHRIQDTVEIDHSIQDSIVLEDMLGKDWQIKDEIPSMWEIKDPMPSNEILIIGEQYDNVPIYLEGTSPPDIEFGRELIVGNGCGITIVENEITLTLPYMEEMDEYQKMDKDFNKHLAHIIQQAKSELTKEVVAIGEGKCKSELIEEKIDWFINLLRKE